MSGTYVVQEFRPRFADAELAVKHANHPLRAFNRVDASPGASARGETVWEAGVALANFIAATFRGADIAGKRVLELGAGCSGYPGRTAQLAGAKYVLLTDSNERALSVLKSGTRRVVPGDNVVADPDDDHELCAERDAEHMMCYGLAYLDEHGLARLELPRLELARLDIAEPAPEFFNSVDAFDIILAADVLYDEDERTCTGLFRTAASLLAPGGRLIIAYAHRADDEFIDPIASGEYGFQCVGIHDVKRSAVSHGWTTELEIVEFVL